MPSAQPWRSGAYHLLTKGTPMANDAPAKPRKKPMTMSAANESCQMASAPRGSSVNASNPMKTFRPPRRSVRIPRGMRMIEPMSTGTAITIATCNVLSPS